MDVIGKYQLVRLIGEGGMGRVYEAIDPIIGRRVAIKTISLNTVIDAETRSRFFREAQAAGQLSHPNLITIHDIGDAEGTPYIVMELLEGMDLQQKLKQEPLSYDSKMQIMIDVCEGLAFAHRHDIIHRDIKPANIFVTTNGRVKILDFGLARGALSEVTQTGKILGSPNYMAPEQIRGEDVDHRADIFATGAVFYELLTGRKAFEGDSIAATIYKVLETQPEPVRLLDGTVPSTIAAVIERALAKDRRARFQASGEMFDTLVLAHGRSTHLERSHLQPAPAAASVPARPRVLVPGAPGRRRAAAIAGWIVAAVTAVGIAVFALINQRAPETSRSAGATQPDPGLRPGVSPPVTPPEAVQAPTPEAPAPVAPARGVASSPADTTGAARARTPTGPAGAVKPAQPLPSPPVVAPPASEPETKAAPAPPAPATPAAAPPEPPAAAGEPPVAAAAGLHAGAGGAPGAPTPRPSRRHRGPSRRHRGLSRRHRARKRIR